MQRRLLLTGSLLLGLSQALLPAANAQGLPPATTNWSGLYLGPGASGFLGDMDWSNNNTGASRSFSLPSGPGKANFDLDAAIGHLKLGYNFQFGNIVAGLESSFNFGSQSDGNRCAEGIYTLPNANSPLSSAYDFRVAPAGGSAAAANAANASSTIVTDPVTNTVTTFVTIFDASGFPIGSVPVTTTTVTAGTAITTTSTRRSYYECQTRFRHSIDLVGRLGYAFGNVLVYGLGGYSTTKYETSANVFDLGSGSLLNSYSDSRYHDGAVAGAGIEFKLGPGLSLGLEYKHLFIQTNNHTLGDGRGNSVRTKAIPDPDFVGLNLKMQLGAPQALLEPPPPPAAPAQQVAAAQPAPAAAAPPAAPKQAAPAAKKAAPAVAAPADGTPKEPAAQKSKPSKP